MVVGFWLVYDSCVFELWGDFCGLGDYGSKVRDPGSLIFEGGEHVGCSRDNVFVDSF